MSNPLMAAGAWSIDKNDWVHKDATGKETARNPRAKLPDGCFLESFAHYKATALHDYPQEGISQGDDIEVVETPGGDLNIVQGSAYIQTNAIEGTDFDFAMPIEKTKEGMDFSDMSVREGVDLIQEMIDAEDRPEMDFDELKAVTFMKDGETHDEGGLVVLYDKSLYAKRFDMEDLAQMVAKGEMPGIIIQDKVVIDLVRIALDSYMHARFRSDDPQSLDLARRIHELLEPLKLF